MDASCCRERYHVSGGKGSDSQLPFLLIGCDRHLKFAGKKMLIFAAPGDLLSPSGKVALPPYVVASAASHLGYE